MCSSTPATKQPGAASSRRSAHPAKVPKSVGRGRATCLDLHGNHRASWQLENQNPPRGGRLGSATGSCESARSSPAGRSRSLRTDSASAPMAGDEAEARAAGVDGQQAGGEAGVGDVELGPAHRSGREVARPCRKLVHQEHGPEPVECRRPTVGWLIPSRLDTDVRFTSWAVCAAAQRSSGSSAVERRMSARATMSRPTTVST